jgi:hypothetical protein
MLSICLQGVNECLTHVHVSEAYMKHTLTIFCQCSFANQFLTYAQGMLRCEWKIFRPKLMTLRIFMMVLYSPFQSDFDYVKNTLGQIFVLGDTFKELLFLWTKFSENCDATNNNAFSSEICA